jgi:hypothetical protein
MAEKTKVKLFSKSLDEKREFDHAHAERLLKFQEDHAGGSDWQLADSNFELKDGAITPTGKGQDRKADKQSGNSGSTGT